MNQFVTMLTAASLLATGGHAFAESTSGEASSTVKQSPFYCDRSALNAEQRRRHFDVLGPALVVKRLGVRELPDGYEFQFPSDTVTFQQVTEWVDGERACCPFFDIGLRVEPEHGALSLRLTGRPGTKQFIQADGGNWLKPVPASQMK